MSLTVSWWLYPFLRLLTFQVSFFLPRLVSFTFISTLVSFHSFFQATCMNSKSLLLTQVALYNLSTWVLTFSTKKASRSTQFLFCIFWGKKALFTIEEIVDIPLEHSSKADILFSKQHFSHLATYKVSLCGPEIHRYVPDIPISLGAICQTIYLPSSTLETSPSVFSLSIFYEHQYYQLQLLIKRTLFSLCCPNHLLPIHSTSNNCFPPFSPRDYLAKQ